MTEPELLPIIATVKAGDTLVFLMPSLTNLRELDTWWHMLKKRYPGVDVSIVPAVGVVHIPQPELKVVCGDIHTLEGMRGFWRCQLESDHEGDHAQGKKKWGRS